MARREGPINELGRGALARIVQAQINKEYDAPRMLSFWRRLFAGDADPEELAQGMMIALGRGDFIPAERAGAIVFNVTVNGDASPEQVAAAVNGALA